MKTFHFPTWHVSIIIWLCCKHRLIWDLFYVLLEDIPRRSSEYLWKANLHPCVSEMPSFHPHPMLLPPCWRFHMWSALLGAGRLLLRSLRTALWKWEDEGQSDFCSLAGNIIFVSRLSGILRLLGFLKVQRTSWGGGGCVVQAGLSPRGFPRIRLFPSCPRLGPRSGLPEFSGWRPHLRTPAPLLLVPHLCCVLESPQALLPTTELPISELHW